MRHNGLHFIGDLKTGTRRFCMDALKDATPPENGAWATFTSTLTLGGDSTIPIYAYLRGLAPRRNPLHD